ncbi:GNAT family N-acetyltransferase [Sphingomonas xinjiangensis]|uniref:Ribosomal protein S18 acetylase RimI-like enzyme n=1 Tax=Sphingomonas xinjiangensis TaxID=643568 RepID=A0A840YI07_9SPHN|nr:GNAT family N-acetyltransferase [Sphingomonas xinjiangensis]MBB5711679.1 ribosomal protein S18 acetylase RimI-like enzyme [Sphingomonas xinjiangensis]
MTAADLDDVVAVAAIAFPDHPEGRACFAERLALCPQLCFVLEDEAGIAGYLIAYPWPAGAIPPLDTLLGALPDERGALYLHDLALLPRTRRQGRAAAGITLLLERARALAASRIALVSVKASAAFWEAQGFRTVEAPPGKLASYGDAACYMQRIL